MHLWDYVINICLHQETGNFMKIPATSSWHEEFERAPEPDQEAVSPVSGVHLDGQMNGQTDRYVLVRDPDIADGEAGRGAESSMAGF